MTSVIGILGLGSIGQRHAQNLMRLGYQVIAHDPADHLSHSRDHVIRSADAVIICSPTKHHIHDLVDVCGGPNGKPALVEKPIAMDAPPEYVRGLLEGVQRNGTPVMVGYNLRFHSAVKRIKEILDRGDLGEIELADLCVLQKNIKYTEPVVLNWSHEIDLALYLFGSAKLVSSDNHQDTSHLMLRHERCRSTSITMDYLADPEVRVGYITGSKKSLAYDLVGRTILIDGVVEKFDDSWDANYLDELTTFLAVLDGHSSSIIATGYDGYHAYKIAYEAMK